MTNNKAFLHYMSALSLVCLYMLIPAARPVRLRLLLLLLREP